MALKRWKMVLQPRQATAHNKMKIRGNREMFWGF
jgi:hypothetical protein